MKYIKPLVAAITLAPLLAIPGEGGLAASRVGGDHLSLTSQLAPGRISQVKAASSSPTPRLVVGRWEHLAGDTLEAKVVTWLQGSAEAFAAAGSYSRLSPISTTIDHLGMSHVKVGQFVGEIAVEGGELIFHFDTAGVLTSVNGEVAPVLRPVTPARVSAEQASVLAQTALEAELAVTQIPLPDSATSLTGSEEVYLALLAGRSSPDGTPHLGWRVDIGAWRIWVDAHQGDILSLRLVQDTADVQTWTYDSSTYDERAVAGEDPYYRADDIDAEETSAHNHGLEYEGWLREAFGRNSLDGNGYLMILTVQYGTTNNAWWDGYSTTYGTGWATRDIVGHELTHGLTQFTAGLDYYAESGALNESFSDVFGVMIDRDDWQQGEEAKGYSSSEPIRDLSDPHKRDRFNPDLPYNKQSNCGQPAHYDELLTSDDPLCGSTGDYYNECVHFNSGITNHAAYLLAQGGEAGGVSVTGVGRSITEQIFFRTLTTRLTSYDDMQAASDNMLIACAELYGSQSQACISTQNSLAAVGLAEVYTARRPLP